MYFLFEFPHPGRHVMVRVHEPSVLPVQRVECGARPFHAEDLAIRVSDDIVETVSGSLGHRRLQSLIDSCLPQHLPAWYDLRNPWPGVVRATCSHSSCVHSALATRSVQPLPRTTEKSHDIA